MARMPTEIYFGVHHGYEVQYNVELDHIEVRRLHWVTEGAYYGDRENIYGRRSSGQFQDFLVRKHEEWKPYDGFEDLLEVGRNKTKAILAMVEAEMTAAKEAAAVRATKTPMEVDVNVWGNISINGEPLNHELFMGEELEVSKFFPDSYLVNGNRSGDIFNGPMFSIRERNGGVEITMTYLAED